MIETPKIKSAISVMKLFKKIKRFVPIVDQKLKYFQKQYKRIKYMC